MKTIPYAHQDINQKDINAVLEVLQSDWLTQGPALERFERAVAEYCGAHYAVAVSSATAALHLACMAAGLKEGEYLWTSPNTFVASANCGRYCGAGIDFVDIDGRTYNLSVTALQDKLERAKRAGKIPRVVIPVHFAGQSCDMKEIKELADWYGFTVLEDASHALGGRYLQTRVGSCAYSDITVLSFHPVKIITTGEGGMILTNRKDLYDRLIRLRSHGITRKPEQMKVKPPGAWYYEQIELGYNYRMTEIQAALGLSQMQRLDEFVCRRQMLAERYNESLRDLPVIRPWQDPSVYSAYHLYVLRIDRRKAARNRSFVYERLREAGIFINVHYIPVHTQPYYQDLGFCRGDYPEAERYYEEALSLPMYYGLTEEEQDYVIDKLHEVLK